MSLDDYKLRINELRGAVAEAGRSMDLPRLKEELEALEKEIADPNVWSDLEKSNKLNKQLKALRTRLDAYASLSGAVDDLEALLELAAEEADDSLLPEIEGELKSVEPRVEQLRLSLLLKGAHDSCDAVLSLHAGAGGTEAQDWVEMLYRMYTRYCERHGYGIRVLDYLDGEEAGIKSVAVEVTGENAYGYLKAERGVHRLVRISPFDSSGRRHTSFASLDVTPITEEDADIEINPDDLRVDTYRSSGAGGQHVNKTESAIRITHLPSGVVVQCQNERSQIQNRETAMRMLRGKLLEIRERENMEKMASIKGEMKKIEWGSQIRSYVFHPYSMVKDHRTGEETGNIGAVMDGELDAFITAFLVQS